MKKFKTCLSVTGVPGTIAPRSRPLLLVILFFVVLLPSFALARGVQPLFNLESPTGSSFPSDHFTVEDPSHNTGLRVNLPKPDCAVRPSDCEDLDVINTLDGFNLQPRLSIPFDGPIDVTTVTSKAVFLISLGSTLRHGDHGGKVIGINQVVWDPATLTLHAESDEFLDQHTRYALIVTRGIRDLAGTSVEATEAFMRFRQYVRGDYKQALLDAIKAAREVGVHEGEIAVASVFTTQSVTPILEKIRDQIKATIPAPADFRLGDGGTRTVFPLDAVTGITFNQQTGDNPPRFTAVQLNIALLRFIPGAVGQLAFGKYDSPDYETAEKFIPPFGTRTGTPEAQGINEIYFNLFLPTGPMPQGGWPVAIFGHGSGAPVHKNNNPLPIVASMAKRGIATIAINAVGHGFGPLGTLTANLSGGTSVTFSAGGRGIDQDGNGTIGASEGLLAAPPRTIIKGRDGGRQSVVDLMQLVRVIEVGMDVNGDGFRDLDPSRIYYLGFSFAGQYGSVFLAVEPNVRAGVLNVPFVGSLKYTRLSPGSRPGLVGISLESRVPSLINSPGITSIDGIPVGPPHFNENMPLRNQPPVINTVAGAMEIQAVLENMEWVLQSGNSVAYAPHIRRDPLDGISAKPVIIQFAKGDQTNTNPSTTAILRAGDLADRATFFRHDLFFAENPTVPKDPHAFLAVIANPMLSAIALGYQEQIAVFFASDGTVVIHPEPARFFEVPIVPPLPEDLFFIP
jgi:hypothetical protein